MARTIGPVLCASIALFYWLPELSDRVSLFNVFRYVTFRTGADSVADKPAALAVAGGAGYLHLAHDLHVGPDGAGDGNDDREHRTATSGRIHEHQFISATVCLRRRLTDQRPNHRDDS